MSVTPARESRFRVLVFPCGTEIGLEIHRALCRCTHVEVFGANSLEPSHGPFVFKNYLPRLPFVDDPLFLTALIACLKEHRIDFLYPAHDDVALALARHAGELPCAVIGSPRETCEMCRSKSATYARLAGTLPVPRLYGRPDAAVPLPVFLKPDRGEGSRGARKAHALQDWEEALKTDPTLLAMEYLPGPEYTVDCFTDRHGALRFAGPRERVRTAGGISMHTRPMKDAQLIEAADRINQTLALRGAWFFQMKRDQRGALTLLEIAPRVSGGMGLYRNLGVNLPLLSVYDAAGKDVDIDAQDYDISLDRALVSRFHPAIRYDHVYVDLDDTLVAPEGVDPLVAAFLFQCRNRGKILHLLTRHAGNAPEILALNALAGMFDTVTHVTGEQRKSAYITYQDAIFIDDSFSERKEVHQALGIPVFAPDAVESLLDWRR